jgi:hypothetical protein
MAFILGAFLRLLTKSLSRRVARAAPDGYTIMMGQLGTLSLSVALYPNLSYRPDVDFAPIGRAVD